ncbi:MAG TPA: hypothetical protein VGT44_21855, partial [Ktedonobacteraceae bacterium]|nr:hypothetical protein [Ktedonobacteraceae bacterium]
MQSIARTMTVVKVVGWIAAAMIVIVVFHLGGIVALRVGQFSPLTGAFIGGTLTLACVLVPMRKREQIEPWIKHERVAWALIGCGVLMWGFGESFWRYYISIGQQPFPSTADIGYSSFPPLVFLGLLLQPSPGTGNRRLLLVLDSLIAMGSILSIAWYLLLGSLAQAPGEANLAKFLGLYYPVADMALLSCVVFLVMRGQGRTYLATARRAGLLVIALGLCFFVFSDFLFNVQNNAGTYVEATWIDLGWPLGLMTIGIAACLRRFLPVTSIEVIEERMDRLAEQDGFGLSRYVPYILLTLLFIALTANVLSTDSGQIAIRPVLLFATMGVVALVVARQLLTLWENIRLSARQAEALEDLERANHRIEEQAHHIADHSEQLERGIAHLKHVQAQLSNGNLQARAELTSGVLLPLAGSLNLMAERLTRLGQASVYTRRLLHSLGELSVALERAASGANFTIPASCHEFVEIDRLLVALRSNNRHLMASYTPEPPSTPLPRASQSLPPVPSMPPMPVTPSASRPGTEPLLVRPAGRMVFGSSASRPFPASGSLRASAPAQSTPADGMRPLPSSGSLPPLQSIRRPPSLEAFGGD